MSRIRLDLLQNFKVIDRQSELEPCEHLAVPASVVTIFQLMFLRTYNY